MAARTEPVCKPVEGQPQDVVTRVGPGLDEALAELLRRLSSWRTRLRLKRKEEASPPDEESSAPEDSES